VPGDDGRSMTSTSSWNPISGSGPDMGNQSLDDWVPLEYHLSVLGRKTPPRRGLEHVSPSY
jgi:hypothetical protein